MKEIVPFVLMVLVSLLVSAQFPNANANKSPGNNYMHAPNTIVRTVDDMLVVKARAFSIIYRWNKPGNRYGSPKIRS